MQQKIRGFFGKTQDPHRVGSSGKLPKGGGFGRVPP